MGPRFRVRSANPLQAGASVKCSRRYQQCNHLATRQHAVEGGHNSAWLAIRGRQPEQRYLDNVLRVWRVHCRAQPEGQSAERQWSGAIMTGGVGGRVDRGAAALYVPAWWSQAIRLAPPWHHRWYKSGMELPARVRGGLSHHINDILRDRGDILRPAILQGCRPPPPSGRHAHQTQQRHRTATGGKSERTGDVASRAVRVTTSPPVPSKPRQGWFRKHRDTRCKLEAAKMFRHCEPENPANSRQRGSTGSSLTWREDAAAPISRRHLRPTSRRWMRFRC